MASENTYDVVVLDIMLPGIDGLSILDKLRESGKESPVLFLTAKDTVADRVDGLRRGADDYLVKPFALEELLARIDALARRSYQKAAPKLAIADLEIDTAAKSASRGGKVIDLTAREYAILEHLMLRQGAVVSRTEIEEHIYDEMVSPMSNVVDSAVCTLRRKIATAPDSEALIHTRRGQGYVLERKS
jgi:DNA-binding response OmpR family regulator